MSLNFKILILALISWLIPFNLLAQIGGTSCTNAVNVNVNSCTSSAVTFSASHGVNGNATMSAPCSGTVKVGEWYMFTSLSSPPTIPTTITVSGASPSLHQRNLGIELYEDAPTCPTLNQIACAETGTTIPEVITATLNASTTYYIRVVNTATATAQHIPNTYVCVYQAPNDIVDGAIPLTLGTGTCNYTAYPSFNQNQATNASGSGTDCWANPPCGTYAAGSNDVWFSTVVPPSGEFFINTKGNSPAHDYAMAVYSSSVCATASILGCSTTNPEGLGGMVNYTRMPTLYITGAVPNSTVYIRVWKETGTIQNFSICVNDMGPCGNLPNNDFCSNPISINTSGASPGDVAYNATGMTYTTDKPGDLQTIIQYSTSPCKAPTNNAWYSFVATKADSASGLTIPFTYGAPCTPGGLSATILSVTTNTNGCCKEFLPIACQSSTTTTSFNIAISPAVLKPGVTYYLMVNGLSDANCQFNITGWSIAGTLPVNFMSFLSENEGKCNVINWQTNTDYNVSTYLLERSYDAMSFEPVAEIKSSQQYNGNKYVVRDVGMKHTDIIYYRVRVLTLSGEKKYSNIISLNLNSLYESILNLHPNPTTADLNFEYYLKYAGNIQVSLVDYAGKTAFDTTYQLTEGKNKLTLPMSSLENGVYILKVVAEKSGKTTYNKVVKN